jgi:hypothetical protein
MLVKDLTSMDQVAVAIVAIKNYILYAMNNAHIWTQLQELHGDKVEMMPEETDWLDMDWIINGPKI